MTHFSETTPLYGFIVKALELGASGFEIEYKDGYEEIVAIRGHTGVSIGRLDSDSEEASLFRDDLYSLCKRKKKIFAAGREKYAIKVKKYDSFGEDAFQVMIDGI
jgi:hypothetical protein